MSETNYRLGMFSASQERPRQREALEPLISHKSPDRDLFQSAPEVVPVFTGSFALGGVTATFQNGRLVSEPH